MAVPAPGQAQCDLQAPSPGAGHKAAGGGSASSAESTPGRRLKSAAATTPSASDLRAASAAEPGNPGWAGSGIQLVSGARPLAPFDLSGDS